MIARRIPPKATRETGFKRLGLYISSEIASQRQEPGGDLADRAAGAAEVLGAYIADQGRHEDRVSWTRITNCHFSDNVKGAIAEIAATQDLNTRMKADANYHLLVSFPPGELPTREQIEDIEDTLVAGLGLSEHQRISALHDDKAHLHLHVAINLIHPETHKGAKVWRDHTTLAELAAKLEIKHGLQLTNHEFPAERGQCRRSAEATIEAHSAREPFTDWVKRVSMNDLKAAVGGEGGWEAIHKAAAKYDLELRQRGAGLVIGKRGEPALNMKASDLDRSFGYQQLVERLGPFQPAGVGVKTVTAEATYSRDVPPNRRGNRSLWEKYAAHNKDAFRAKADFEAAGKKYVEELNRYYRDQYGQIKRWRTELFDPRARAEALRQQRAKDMAAYQAFMKKGRAKLSADRKVETWPDFLRAEAARGNDEATAELRRQAASQERFSQTLVSTPQAAGRVLNKLELKPRVTRGGDIVYRLPDGGSVVDKRGGLQMPTPSRAAAVLILDLAQERAGGQPLSVSGTPQQIAAIVEAAVQLRAPVTFADPELEVERQRRLEAVIAISADDGAGRSDAVSAIVAGRNRWPAPGDDTNWRPLKLSDEGTVEFVAIVKVSGGELAFWRTGGETLVQDISGQQESIAFRLLPGDRVPLDDVIQRVEKPTPAPGGGSETDQEYEI